MSKTIDYEGTKVKYDDSCLGKWSFLRKLQDPNTSFAAVDELLLGASDAVAAKLGDSVEAMADLTQRILVIEGKAKN